MIRQRIAVLGGGITGTVLARELAKAPHISVDLIERAPRLGGLHRSVTIDGTVYDIGAFVFYHTHSIFKTFPEVQELCVSVQSKYVSITPSGRLDSYPMTIRGYIADNGILHCGFAFFDILYSKLRHAERDTLSSYIQYYLGHSIYTRSGLKNYIERLYGIPDREVALEFATARLSLIENWASLRRIAANLVWRKQTVFSASPVKTGDLVRPSEGFDTLYGRVEELLRAAGVGILTGRAIRAVRPSSNGFAVDLTYEIRHYDRVVSTIPLSTMSQLVGLQFPEGVEYAKLFSLFYRFSGDTGHDATLLHNFTLEGLWKRVTTFSLYYTAPAGEQYFVVEGTLKENVDLDEALLREDFESHVRRLGLYRGILKYQGCILTDHAYPVYRLGNLERVLAAKVKLRELGIDLSGRQGEFDYISSSDAAGSAQRLARAILENLAHAG